MTRSPSAEHTFAHIMRVLEEGNLHRERHWRTGTDESTNRIHVVMPLDTHVFIGRRSSDARLYNLYEAGSLISEKVDIDGLKTMLKSIRYRDNNRAASERGMLVLGAEEPHVASWVTRAHSSSDDVSNGKRGRGGAANAKPIIRRTDGDD